MATHATLMLKNKADLLAIATGMGLTDANPDMRKGELVDRIIAAQTGIAVEAHQSGFPTVGQDAGQMPVNLQPSADAAGDVADAAYLAEQQARLQEENTARMQAALAVALAQETESLSDQAAMITGEHTPEINRVAPALTVPPLLNDQPTTKGRAPVVKTPAQRAAEQLQPGDLTQQQVLDELAPFIERGLRVSFDGRTWHLAYMRREDSGSMEMGINMLIRCANRVMGAV